jgi:hypothetical protein
VAAGGTDRHSHAAVELHECCGEVEAPDCEDAGAVVSPPTIASVIVNPHVLAHNPITDRGAR